MISCAHRVVDPPFSRSARAGRLSGTLADGPRYIRASRENGRADHADYKEDLPRMDRFIRACSYRWSALIERHCGGQRETGCAKW